MYIELLLGMCDVECEYAHLINIHRVININFDINIEIYNRPTMYAHLFHRIRRNWCTYIILHV